MFRQEDIIHKVPITEYYQLNPTEHNINISKLQSGQDYVLTVEIKNLTGHWLAWKLRTLKRCILKYMPKKKASCIPPHDSFLCYIVISLHGSIPKESLVSANKPDKFQIMGTVLANEQEGDELEATLAERLKLHNKLHKSYVYQETNFKCHLIKEPEELPLPTVLRPRAFSQGSGSVRSKSGLEFNPEQPRLSVSQQPEMFNNPSVSHFRPAVGGTVLVPPAELSNLRALRQKAKQHDELIKQITKTLRERDEALLKLREQITENNLVRERYSKLEEELKKSKYAKSNREDGKTGDEFSKMFFEDFPCDKHQDFKQPPAISLSMTLALTLSSSVFYIIGRYFRD
jgi:hypothetical protein